MRRAPAGVKFTEVLQVCRYYFGEARQSSSSHVVFATPWPGDPRVNVQNDHGRAKAYQVRQVLLAIDRLSEHT
ncbi:MAG: toxin HicA [Rhodoglobus sp.]